MSIILLALGLLVTAVGFVTIGFGIPINAFSLGNTLIISGTIAVAGGLILIGLALVLGQLKRLVLALNSQGLARAARLAESAETMTQPSVRVAAAPAVVALPPEPDAAEPQRPVEPRAPAPEPAAGPLDWLRAKSKTGSAPAVSAPLPPNATEPPMVDLTDEAPLSPRVPQRPAMPPVAEPTIEPKLWSPNRETAPLEQRPTLRPEPPLSRAAPQAEPPKEKERFDLVWPDRGSPAADTRPEARIEPKIDIRPEPKLDQKREPALDMPLPPVPARPRETKSASERRMPEVLRRAAERSPAILKSGVIDGMPYTLYADGSIEAQLPQGMVKFASVDALRAHLEKQG